MGRITSATVRGLCAVFAMAITGTSRLAAEPIAWTGAAGNGSWHTAGNWDLNRLPTAADDVTIGIDGTYSVMVTSNASAASLSVGGTTGTQTLVISATTLTVAANATILPNGVVNVDRTNGVPNFDFPAVGGTLTNQGTVNVLGGTGNCHLRADLNNQGLFTVQGPLLQLGHFLRNHTVTNTGTISVTAGAFTSYYGDGSYYSGLSLVQSGTINVAAGALFRQANGTLTVNGGTFGGAGQLILFTSTVNLAADFHTADWGSLSVTLGSINGPGTFINDKAGGFSPDRVTFNAMVSNETILNMYHGAFNGGLANPNGATLRLYGDNNYSQTLVSSGFTNEGLIELISPGHSFTVQGTLVNAATGQIVVKREGTSAAGWRVLNATVVNNQGTLTSVDVSTLMLGGFNPIVINSGTINIQNGNFGNRDDQTPSGGTPVFTNTGAVNFAPGTYYRHQSGTLNLNGGSFGGTGANLDLRNLTVNLAADFHTADWSAGLYILQCTFNGSGAFINDKPGGFSPDRVTFNTMVSNLTILNMYHGAFNGGLANPNGATLRLYGDNNYSQTLVSSGFTNEGQIELIGLGHIFTVQGTLVNAPTGQIVVKREGTPDGWRNLNANVLDNQGTITSVDVSNLYLGGFNPVVINSGTINIQSGNFANWDGVNSANNLTFTNTGAVNFAPGTLYRQRIGTLNLNGGSFGGVGANLDLRNLTVNHPADFHTADWSAGLYVNQCTFNGPGLVINDRVAGFDPVLSIFNTLVDNRTVLSPDSGAGVTQFYAGLLNPAGSLLRLFGDNNFSSTNITGGFTNDGTVHIISRGTALNVLSGPLVNNGLIEARREGAPDGGRTIIAPTLNNYGTINSVDVSDFYLGGSNPTVNNSGTINIQSGNFANWDGVNSANDLTFTNTGAVNFAPGTLYRQRLGTLNLNGGSFGGTGANLDLRTMTVNHPADFHTAAWASIYWEAAIMNGPGTFVNDHPVGFTGTSTEGNFVGSFNTLVDNRSVFTSHGCRFTAGFLNPLGATLRVRYRNIGANITNFLTAVTNHGVIEIIDPGAAIRTIGPAPNYTMLTLTNSPTGRIHVHHLETTAAWPRYIASNILNYGEFTIHDVPLGVGGGNYFQHIWNYGTFNVLGGDLYFSNGPLDEARIENHGLFHIGVGRNINNGSAYYGGNNTPFNFINHSDGILSGSGTIHGPVDAGGIIRPGGEGVVGTLNIVNLVTVPGDPFAVNAVFEFDVGGPGAQAHDVLIAPIVQLNPQGGRLLSVNILGQNLPPLGDSVSMGGFPFVASNLPVTDGVVCIGCFNPGGGTYCGGSITVLETGCAGPGITQQPQSISLCPGDTATLSVVASGADPLTYQWKRLGTSLVDGPIGNGAVIAGANGPTLTISNFTVNEFGAYAVTVSDANGTRTSAHASITRACLINVTADTPQSYLDSLTTTSKTLVMEYVANRPTLLLPALTGLGGTMRVAGNAGLTTLQAQLLATIGGDVEVSDNPLLGEVDLSSLSGAGGDVVIENNNSPQIDLSSLSGAGGDIVIENNNNPQIDLSSLSGAGGDVVIENNNQTTPFTVAALQTIGGHLSIRNNLLLPSVHMPLLTQVVGDVDISNDPLLGEVDFSSLGGVSGDITITNNGDPVIDFGALGGVSGDITITNNGDPAIDFGALGGVSGDITIANNDTPPPIDLSSLETVGGDVTLETAGQTDVDLSGAAVAGNTDVSAEGATSVEVQVPGGTTSVEMCNDAACMDADLPDDAAPAGTPFAVLRVDPQALTRVPGLDETGQPAGVDPVAAYAFTLGAPLQGPASLVFELTLASLSPEEQAAVLDAYTDGRLTLTVQADAPGSVPQARAQCGPADALVADGCVKVGAFDALGFQLPPGVTAGAVTIRIAALVSHFSTYAVSIVTGRGDMNCDGEIDLADVEPFVQALTDPAAYAAAHPACPALGADINQDGTGDGRDLQLFVNMVVVP